jgi:hypothetical protein
MRATSRMFSALVAGSLGLFQAAACGGPNGSGPQAPAGEVYSEYTCPDPIGKIVREDCSKSQLKYDGKSFEGSVNAMGVGASASYKESAVREADALVALLKEQRGQLCNNFNTCKLTVAEYREDQRKLDDSFVALMTLKDRMSNLDADGAQKLLAEIRSIRAGARVENAAPQASGSPPVAAASASSASTSPVASATPTTSASAGSPCKGPSLQVARRGTIAGPDFGYDKTREALKGHPELSSVEWLEFLIETGSLSGVKKEYVLVAVAPDRDTAEKTRKILKDKVNPSSGVDIPCPAIPPSRKLTFSVN